MILDNLKFFTKMMLPLILMAGMFVGVVALSASNMNEVSTKYRYMTDHTDLAGMKLSRFSRALQTELSLEYRLVVDDCAGVDAQDCATTVDNINHIVTRAKGMLADAIALDAGSAAALNVIHEHYDTVHVGAAKVIKLALADAPGAKLAMRDYDDQMNEVNQRATTWLDQRMATSLMETNLLRIQAENSLWSSIGFGLTAIVIGAGVTAWMSISKMSGPLTKLAAVMRSLAGGDLTADVIGQTRRDEIGAMAQAVQVFKENALNTVALNAQIATDRAAAEAGQAHAAAERAQEAAHDQHAITALAEGLDALANGNLTHQITQDLAPKTQRLKDDFNLTANRLRETMVTIAGLIQSMTTGTGEISQAADDLSRRTEQQAASLEQTAAALDEITATVRKTAEGAQHAQGAVSTAKKDAELSSGIVREAVTAMDSIESSSNQISQIISVIDEIAFQTNLLALNAGVEAARAGDAGRGFAVVASEVRALAQRSAEAAKEIKQLISTSSRHVTHGVKLVGETGESLQRIVKQVDDVYGAISDIAASAKEQATGLQEVNTAVNQMDQVTQQNAAMVEQSTAASHGLAHETLELSRLTGYFQIETRSARPAPAPRAAAPAAKRPPLKMVARGAPRAAVVAAAPEGWEEF